jgi:hypothetical protein
VAAYQREEIVQMYKEAADKNKQIKILAQLNCCSEAEILNILAEAGAISGVKPSKMQKKQVDKRRSERGKWTEERLEQLQRFIDEGLTYEEIGERLGDSEDSIANAVYNYKLRGIGSNASKKKADVVYDVVEAAAKSPAPKEANEPKEEKVQATEENKKVKELKVKTIQMQNELDDIAEAAKVVKDLVMLPCMVSFEECESFEGMVQEILYRAGELLSEIIKRAEGETK